MAKNHDNVISAFSDEQTARLVGLSVAQLRNWDRTGFFVPSLAAENRRSAFSRVYTFADLLSLQVLKTLRKDMGCSLQHLRDVKIKLKQLPDAGWSQSTLYVLGKRVVFKDPDNDEFYEPVDNQKVFKIPLHVVRSDMKSAVRGLWKRNDDDVGKVANTRRVVHNKAVFSGTRITVQSVIDFWEAGYSEDQILAEFPTLSMADVSSAIEDAA
ncbi:DUF433 domain-containing protein [Octadecabacter sp. 1_MG-2023]|uniref:DUF433 domain-containing protein n=1 Tax=unclassified Octadecabacter TaxID=196158 RepID=UPI001C092C4D|nr:MULTISPECIES: DUF433 domain-containing protein [unclassified Octadecabacter]MBU2992425.1 DUF433 domain-containing protein [Octadecabacter sp. B2R22]MDO6734818.1 DUF433 domain-containing protein [Octadecabacter sp. 1_MG-2023]